MNHDELLSLVNDRVSNLIDRAIDLSLQGLQDESDILLEEGRQLASTFNNGEEFFYAPDTRNYINE